MNKEPSSIRPHVVLIGRRNVGKSSLINALTEQPLAIVSDVPGTTTDPVRKPFELLPFGPVVFIDTGGIDDTGDVGVLRVRGARKELAVADFALMVVEAGTWTADDEALFDELAHGTCDFFVVVNKIDRAPDWKPTVEVWNVSAATGAGVRELREALSDRLRRVVRPSESIIGDLVRPGGLIVMVVPIDLEAPRGRLILPQVMTIRDVLDNDAAALVVKERELYATLTTLGREPDLIVCDSQVVLRVTADAPRSVPVTTFSILFARLKGDLGTFVRGARRIDELADGDRVLIAEACSHHAVADDIGRVKIPRWMRQYTGRDLIFENAQGRAFPDDLERYRLVVHCGGCMITPRVMQARMRESTSRDVPITNYGVAISHVQGVLPRVLEPFGGLAAFVERPTVAAG